MNAAVFHLIQVNWVLMSKQAQGVAGGVGSLVLLPIIASSLRG